MVRSKINNILTAVLIFSFQMFTIVYSKLCIFISALVELMMQLLTCSHDHYTEVIFFLHVLLLNKLS